MPGNRKTASMLKLLESVAEQKLGYSFGKPLRVDEKKLAVVLPILRETSLNRQYVTFPETGEVDVFDTGKIDEMEANNRSTENVFIRSGTLFKGATQERALQRSAVLYPGTKQTLGVRCVHRSRGISGGSKVTYGGITPHDIDKGNYGAGYTPKDQSTTWANVSANSMKMSGLTGKGMGASTPQYMGRIRARIITSAFHEAVAQAGADDLCANFHDFALHFEDLLSKIKLVTNQVGLALINHMGVETVEFFDHAGSWKALHECAVKRLGSNIVDPGESSVFEYKPENAIEAVNRVLALDYKVNPIYTHRAKQGEPEVVISGLTAGRYVGEAVELNGSLVHLVILKTE